MIKKIPARMTHFLIILVVLQNNIEAQSNDTVRISGIPFPLTWDNAPLKFSAKTNQIIMTAGAKTDMFRDPNVTYNTDNAPKLLFKPDDNFTISASVEHAFASKWDGGAIVIKQDSLHWIKFCFEKDYTQAKRVVSVVTKDFSDDCNSIQMNTNKVFYKLAKADNVITLYYSTDGTSWYLIRHLEFEFNNQFRVGFLAQSPTGQSCTVKFSDIRYKNIKIKDPYKGE